MFPLLNLIKIQKINKHTKKSMYINNQTNIYEFINIKL